MRHPQVFTLVSVALFCAGGLLGEPTPAHIKSAKEVAIYAPRPKIPPEILAKHLTGAGTCVLYFRPDGTVERAEMLKSTGQPILDKITIDTFSSWRFLPGYFTKMNIPITYTGGDTNPPNPIIGKIIK